MKPVTGAKVVISLMAAVSGAVLFDCGSNSGPSRQSQILQRAESNGSLEDQLAALESEVDDAISFINNPPDDPVDGSFPDPDAIEDGTSDCTCGVTEYGVSDLTLGALPACGDANARLRQQLNDMRTLGAQVETRATTYRTTAEAGIRGTGTLLNVSIPGTRTLVNDFFNAGRITAAQRDRFLADLNTAQTKLTEARDKYTAARDAANLSILNAVASQQYAQQGLDALNQCPPDAAAARTRANLAARAGATSTSAALDALTRNTEGRAKAAEGGPLVQGVLRGLP